MRCVFLTIIATLALGSQVHALELTVGQCVALGLKNNYTLKAQQSLVESAQQDKKISRSEFLPTLEAQGNYTILDQPQRFIIEKDVFGQGFPPSDTKIEDESTLYGAGLTLRQTLYAGGRITHAYQRDNELLAAAQHEFGNWRTQLAYDLKRTFYEILIHRQYIDSYNQQVVTRQEALRITRVLVAEGQLGEAEIDQALAKLMFSEAGLMEAQQRAVNALDRLRHLLALDGAEELTLIEDLTYPELKNPVPELSVVAISNREDLKQLDAKIKAAEESLMVAKGSYQPEFYTQGNYLRQRETNLARADTWMASINFEWSLFEGGKTDAQVAKAKIELQRLKDLRHDLASRIRNEVLAVQRRVEQKQLLVEAYRVNLKAEERIYQDLLGRKTEGEVTAIDQAEQNGVLLMARTNYLENINQLRIAVAALESTLAAPASELLTLHDIYRPNLSKIKPPDRKQAMTIAASSVPAAAEAVIPSTKQLPAPFNGLPAMKKNGYDYVVQLGAFKSEERAIAFVHSLESQYPKMKFEAVSTKGFYKVRTRHLQSREAAVSTLEMFKGKGFILHANTSH